MWFIFWIVVMLALVIATSVVAMRENKARQAAIKKMNPAATEPAASPIATADDGFGQQDPLAGFDESGSASFDEEAFK